MTMFWVGAHCRVTASMGDGEVAFQAWRNSLLSQRIPDSCGHKTTTKQNKKPNDQVETNKERNVNEMYHVCTLIPCDGLNEKRPP